MNDRHLHKAKRMDNGEWIEGFYVLCRGHHYILPVYDIDHGFDERYAEWIEVDPSILCRCTGMMDKNNKLIWENSKCSVERPCIYAVGHIKYLSGCFCFVEDGTRHILRLCDIKSNGYEIKVESGNPELLEVE